MEREGFYVKARSGTIEKIYWSGLIDKLHFVSCCCVWVWIINQGYGSYDLFGWYDPATHPPVMVMVGAYAWAICRYSKWDGQWLISCGPTEAIRCLKAVLRCKQAAHIVHSSMRQTRKSNIWSSEVKYGHPRVGMPGTLGEGCRSPGGTIYA